MVGTGYTWPSQTIPLKYNLQTKNYNVDEILTFNIYLCVSERIDPEWEIDDTDHSES